MEGANDGISNYQEVTERMRQVFQEFIEILPNAIGYMRGEFLDIQSETSNALQDYNLALRQDRDDEEDLLQQQMVNLYEALRSRDVVTGTERMRVAADYAYNMGQLTDESDNNDVDTLNNERIETIIDNLNNSNGWVNYIREHLPNNLDNMLRQIHDNVMYEYAENREAMQWLLMRVRYGLILVTFEIIEDVVNTNASENAVYAILVMLTIFGINNSFTRSLLLLLIPLTVLSPGHRRMLFNVISGVYNLPNNIQRMVNELDFRRLYDNDALNRITQIVEGSLTYGSLLITNATNYINNEGEDYIPTGAELEEIGNTLGIQDITEFPPRDMYVNYVNEPAVGYEYDPGGHGRYPVRDNRNNWVDRNGFRESLRNLANEIYDFFDGYDRRAQNYQEEIGAEEARRRQIMDDYYDMPESQNLAEYTDEEDNSPRRSRSPQRRLVNYPDSDEEQGLVEYSDSDSDRSYGSRASMDTNRKLRRRRTSKKSKYGKSGKPGKNNRRKSVGRRMVIRRPVGRTMVLRRPVGRRLSRRRPVGRRLSRRKMVNRRRKPIKKLSKRKLTNKRKVKKNKVKQSKKQLKKKVNRKNKSKRRN